MIAEAIDRILGLVPPIVWALLCALLFGWGSLEHVGRTSAEASLETTRTQLAELGGAVKAQKAQAQRMLADLTAQVAALQETLNLRRRAQEATDAKNEQVIADQSRRLAALSRDAGGRGLWDPNATGCRRSGDAAEGGPGPAAGPGSVDASQAPGLLSVQLERLLLRLTAEADAVNIAYASCRADALNVRGMPPLPNEAPP